MMKIFPIFLLINTICCMKFSLITNFLKENNIKLCHVLICWTKKEIVKLNLVANQLNIRHSFLLETKNFKILKQRNITKFGYILDWSCPEFRDFLQKINEKNFRSTYPWLILTKKNFRTKLKHIKLRLDSNVQIALETKINNFKLFDVYNPGFNLGGQPMIIDNNYFLKQEMFYKQRKNLATITIRSGSVVLVGNHSGSFEEYMQNTRTKQYDTLSKFHYSLFLILKEIHKFNHGLIIKDAWFGNLPSGIDDGVCQLLYEDQIDITSTGATQRAPRIDVVDYLMPSYRFRPVYIFRNPESYDPLSNEFLKPFSKNIWFIILVLGSLICIFLKLSFCIERNIIRNTSYCWAAVVLVTLSTVSQQGSNLFPNNLGGRLVFLVLLLTSILLYNYYTSTIISILLNSPPVMLTTLNQLGHSKLEIGIENVPYTITWFKIINESDVQYIYKKKVNPPGASHPNILTSKEGIAKVKKGNFAYHTQADTGYPIIAKTFEQDSICDLNEISMIPQSLAGIMVQKKSQYFELFQITLRKAKLAGIIKRNSLIWETNKPGCLTNMRVLAVNVNQIFMAFLTLMTGMGVALAVLLGEIFWKKCIEH